MSTSPNVLFNIFNNINSNLAYFDESHNIEILYLNDLNEFENEVNKQLEKKIEPMELLKLLIWAMMRTHV